MTMDTTKDERRFFDVDFGIDYTIVARDEDHVIEVLREADHDFAETYWEYEGVGIKEIPREVAEKRTIWDDGVGQHVPLVSLPLGAYASSEF